MFGLIPWRRESRSSRGLSPRYDNPLQMMQDQFQSMVDQFFGGTWPGMQSSMMMPFSENYFPRNWGLDLEERDNEVLVRAEMPGFETNEIDVHLANNILTIEGKHPVREGHENEPRQYNQVRRSVTLPAGLDVERIDAHYRNGILEIHVPRRPEAQGRRIEIKS
jgi:HSP20 family protein